MDLRLKKENDKEKQNLKYGEIHCFYPINIETDKNIEQICEEISNSRMLLSEDKCLQVKNQIRDRAKKFEKHLKKETSDVFCLRTENFEQSQVGKELTIDENTYDLYVKMISSNRVIKIFFKSTELDVKD